MKHDFGRGRCLNHPPAFNLHPLISPRISQCEESPASALIFLSFPVVFGRGGIELPAVFVALLFFLSDSQRLVIGVGDPHRRCGFLRVVLVRGRCTSCRSLVALRLGHVPLRVDVTARERGIDAVVLAKPVVKLLRSGGDVYSGGPDTVVDAIPVSVFAFVLFPVNELFGLVHVRAPASSKMRRSCRGWGVGGGVWEKSGSNVNFERFLHAPRPTPYFPPPAPP